MLSPKALAVQLVVELAWLQEQENLARVTRNARPALREDSTTDPPEHKGIEANLMGRFSAVRTCTLARDTWLW